MISILIPIYNYDVTGLVAQLLPQMEALNADCEIICIEDGSKKEWIEKNAPLKSLPKVKYEVLEKNIGRSAIRNLLAEKARFAYLLFMDGDSGVRHDGFLKAYLAKADMQSVVCGGRVYALTPPSDPKLMLHWKYGVKRESQPAKRRQLAPHQGFMSNNFLVSKQLFKKVLFDDSIVQYGHEDTLFGYILGQKRIPILHIDNPVVHEGLETARSILEKTDQAVGNLVKLQWKYPEMETKLSTTYHSWSEKGMMPLFGVVWVLLGKYIIQNLQSSSPQLRFFDAYKLHLYDKHSRTI